MVSSICTLAKRTRQQNIGCGDQAAQHKAYTDNWLIKHGLQAPFRVRRFGVPLAEPLNQQNGDGHFDHIFNAAPKGQVALAGLALAHRNLYFAYHSAVFDQVTDGIRLRAIVQILGKFFHHGAVEQPHAAGGVADGTARWSAGWTS